MKIALQLLAFVVVGLASATEGYFNSNGVKIHYVTEGQGEPIILVHGWMSDTTMWGKDASGKTQLKGLPGFQVIALDCRGHGLSDKPHVASMYGREMAEDVVRLMDHLKIKKAHLVGYSMGAMILGSVAARHPDRVISIIYGGQAPLVVGADNHSDEIDMFAKTVDEGKGLGPYIIQVSPKDKPKPNLQQANVLAAMFFNGKDLKAFALSGNSFPQLAVTVNDLRKCKTPFMFVYGSEDSKETQKRAAFWRTQLGRGELTVVEGADHMTTLVRPEFGKSIIDFLMAHRLK